jgi:hypothetical protein
MKSYGMYYGEKADMTSPAQESVFSSQIQTGYYSKRSSPSFYCWWYGHWLLLGISWPSTTRMSLLGDTA